MVVWLSDIVTRQRRMREGARGVKERGRPEIRDPRSEGNLKTEIRKGGEGWLGAETGARGGVEASDSGGEVLRGVAGEVGVDGCGSGSGYWAEFKK